MRPADIVAPLLVAGGLAYLAIESTTGVDWGRIVVAGVLLVVLLITAGGTYFSAHNNPEQRHGPAILGTALALFLALMMGDKGLEHQWTQTDRAIALVVVSLTSILATAAGSAGLFENNIEHLMHGVERERRKRMWTGLETQEHTDGTTKDP